MAKKLPRVMQWPIARQVARGDLVGLGSSAFSQRTLDLAPRTGSADRVVKSVCPYYAVGCAQLVYVKDEKIIDWFLSAFGGCARSARHLRSAARRARRRRRR